MAIYRNIQMSFWTDTKVADDFTPEDKYFYLYLFTNPHTNLAGCYEIGIRHIVNETGYSKETVERLIKRFSEEHKVAHYSFETKEMLLINWHKYNWTTSDKFRKPLKKQIDNIKCDSFRGYLLEIYDSNDTVSIPYLYPIDTTSIDTTVTVDNNIHTNNKVNYIDIIDIYNSICKSLSKVIKVTDKRNKSIRNILKKYSREELETVFRKAEESDFLSGRNGSWNGCGFDWLINETNMIKVLEGNYDNKGKSKQSDPSSKIWGELIFLDEENRYELPYLGFPKVWFDGDKLIKERVQPVIRPRYTSKGWYEDIEIDVKELLEEYEARGRIANGETTDDLDFGSGGK